MTSVSVIVKGEEERLSDFNIEMLRLTLFAHDNKQN